MARRVWPYAAVALLALAFAVGYRAAGGAASAPAHFADPSNRALVALGKRIYAAYCAACHGRELQGQPLWQLDDQFAGRRAPAQDATGHTWQHADEDLFRKVSDGRFPSQPADPAPPMPAFAAVLDDEKIIAALAFVKAQWPLRLRAAQALLNPGFAGMPANVPAGEWRLPPICRAQRR